MAEARYAKERSDLVARLRRSGIRDERVLDAIERVPRERFVAPDLAIDAYADRTLPIGSGQTISQPFIVARMTELLEPQPHDRVLEIGTGSGYQTAILAELVREVVSIERHAQLAQQAEERLRELGIENVRVVVGDGTAGYPELAPYDGILVAAATPQVPEPLKEQCALGGRIVAPVGDREVQELVVIVRLLDDFRLHVVERVRFVPLIGEHGFREEL